MVTIIKGVTARNGRKPTDTPMTLKIRNLARRSEECHTLGERVVLRQDNVVEQERVTRLKEEELDGN